VLAGVRFDKERVRPGETIRVTAVPVGGQGDGFSAAVINGIRSAQIDDPVNAVPGEKRYAVTVQAPSGEMETMVAAINVEAAQPGAEPFPLIGFSLDPQQPTLLRAEARTAVAGDATFEWDFGDGTREQGRRGHTKHDFAAALGTTEEHKVFSVAVTIHRPNKPDVTTRKSIDFFNDYVIAKRRGAIEPPAETSAVTQWIQVAGAWVLDAHLGNREPLPITYTKRRVDYLTCDASKRENQIGSDETITEIVPAATAEGVAKKSVSVPISRSEAPPVSYCGAVAHYWGTLSDGKPVQTSLWWDWLPPSNPILVLPDVAPTAAREKLLNYLLTQGTITGTSLSDTDLRAAYDAGHLDGYDPNLPEQHTRGGNSVGKCDPATDGTQIVNGSLYTCAFDHWKVERQRVIRNALAGDTIITRGCSGAVLPLLDVLNHKYTHMGLMTADRRELRQSTGEADWLRYEHAIRLTAFGKTLVSEPVFGMEEHATKYLWPGTVTVSVNDAFSFGSIADWFSPDGGRAYGIHGFHEFSQCSDAFVPSRVIKPSPEREVAVRPRLRAAAEFSKSIHGHYRFSAYSAAPTNADADPKAPTNVHPYEAPGKCLDPAVTSCTVTKETYGATPTVCSLFVQQALASQFPKLSRAHRASDATLKLEEVPAAANGLFTFSLAQRQAAYVKLHTFQYDQVVWASNNYPTGSIDDTLGGGGNSLGTGFGNWLYGAAVSIPGTAETIATQLAHCFAKDECAPAVASTAAAGIGHDAAEALYQSQLGEGLAVAPDDVFNFYGPDAESPDAEGPYGYNERAIFADEVDHAVYTWQAAAGTAPLTVHVVRDDTGAPVANAAIAGLPGTPLTDETGTVHFEALPMTDHCIFCQGAGGRLELEASWYAATPAPGYLWQANLCLLTDPAQTPATQPIDCKSAAPFGPRTSEVTLRLTPPPGVVRAIEFHSTVKIVDDDWGDDDVCDQQHVGNLEVLDSRWIYPSSRLDVRDRETARRWWDDAAKRKDDAQGDPAKRIGPVAIYTQKNDPNNGVGLCCDEVGDRVDVATKLVQADPSAPAGSDEREAADHGCTKAQGKTCAVIDLLATQFEWHEKSCGADDFSVQGRRRTWVPRGEERKLDFWISNSSDGSSDFHFTFTNMDGDIR
jgi:hypothetical protein